MTEKHLLFDPSGEISWIPLDRGIIFYPDGQRSSTLNLDQIHDCLDCCFFEIVRTVLPELVLVIDDSGAISDPLKPHNELASKLYLGYLIGGFDICGSAFVMAERPSEPYGEPDLEPLNDKDLARLSLYLGVELPEK